MIKTIIRIIMELKSKYNTKLKRRENGFRDK